MLKKTVVVLALIALSACSSIRSIQNPAKGTDYVDGLTYFMPKKDLLVTVKVEKKNCENVITQITLGTTPSYPDLSEYYVLRYQKNLVGKNTLDVGVNEAGLLTSAKSTTVSQISDVFQKLASTAGLIKPFALAPPKKTAECGVGEHTFVYDFSSGVTVPPCGVNITIKRPPKVDSVHSHSKAVNEEHSGVFYRQHIPYRITADGNGLKVASIVFSPSESPIHFLPISKTFASDNKADFVFSEGIPTKYLQDTDGELVALLKLPADIIGAYFGAIGMVFESFKTTDKKEAEALAESLKLELAKKKYDACISAINAKDEDLITALGCKE
jgi:hypothetical protein